MCHFQFGKQIRECLDMPTLFLSFIGIKLIKSRIDTFWQENLTMTHWIRLSLLGRCKWMRKSQVSGETKSPEQYLLFYEHKTVYCVDRRNLWSSILVYGILSLSMEFHLCLWSSIFVYGVLSLYAVVGCMYMETFGCMYAVVGCMYAETFGCKVCGCWVQVS